MFAEFNYENFPIVKVILNNIENEEEFDLFLENWLKLYLDCKDFIFVFDTKNVNNIDIKYSIRMCDFIKKLKKDYQYHYLQKSIILVNNNFVKKMLNFIFKLQSPVAPVYLIKNEQDINNILNNVNIENIQCIHPGKSFIPFL